MKNTSLDFHKKAREGLQRPGLQHNLGQMKADFPGHRERALSDLPDYETFRSRAVAIKKHTLDHLGFYLEQFETNVQAAGGTVHWAEKPEDLNKTVVDILKASKARRIIKGKSMISEETELNPHLEKAGFQVRETDLGEYIIQLAEEPPSHIIGPAIHKTREEVAELFKEHHDLGARSLDDVPSIVAESRTVLRNDFTSADAGIIGANVLIAETGSVMLVTNEGNGDLTSTLPRVQIVVASIEKVVPCLEDATAVLRVLVRNAIAMSITAYVSFFTGPKRSGDPDGPEEFHVILLDNGRSDILAGDFKDILRCIRCSTCLNHCPIYTHVGGHAYGWVYSGPMGSVLTPLFEGLDKAHHLANACTACGRCKQVCPMDIPLPDMLRDLRAEEQKLKLNSPFWRMGLGAYRGLIRRPWLYRLMTRIGARLLMLAANKGRIRRLPFLGGWFNGRDLAPGDGRTFLDAWEKSRKRGGMS